MGIFDGLDEHARQVRAGQEASAAMSRLSQSAADSARVEEMAQMELVGRGAVEFLNSHHIKPEKIYWIMAIGTMRTARTKTKFTGRSGWKLDGEIWLLPDGKCCIFRQQEPPTSEYMAYATLPKALEVVDVYSDVTQPTDFVGKEFGSLRRRNDGQFIRRNYDWHDTEIGTFRDVVEGWLLGLISGK